VRMASATSSILRPTTSLVIAPARAVLRRDSRRGRCWAVAEAITGRRPFEGETSADVSRAVSHQAYHLPDSSPGMLAIDEALQRCLAKDPSARINSAATLRQLIIPALRRAA
jgi:hypothetical protein